MSTDPLFVLGVLAACVAAAEWLERLAVLRHFGAALLVIVLGAILSNTGVLPRFSQDEGVYAGVFEYVAPLAIFWLLLRVRLVDLRRAGASMLMLFGFAALGTVLGVLAGLAVVGFDAFGERTFALGGMFVGTYTGGSINFNAIAVEYGVIEDGLLYAGANAVDAAMTTVWMIVCVLVPRWLDKGRSGSDAAATRAAAELDAPQPLRAFDLALLGALGALAVWASHALTAQIATQLGIELPSMLVLTTIALVLAQVPAIANLGGARVLGLFAVELFLAVIGVLCDLSAIEEIGALAGRLVLFVSVVLLVHGVVVFGLARLTGRGAAEAAVASQAAVGGGSTAMALGKSLGRGDLVLPGILLGALGTALGSYLGFFVAAWLA